MKLCRFLLPAMVLFFFLTNSDHVFSQGKEKLQQTTAEEVTFYLERDLTANYFKNETSLGGIFTTGNVEQISVEGKTTTTYRVKRFRNVWDLGGYYNRKFFDTNDPLDPPETIAKYFYGRYRLDYFLSQNTTYFFGGAGYVDQVKGIPLGMRISTGVSHYFIWTDKVALNLAGGYEFFAERREEPDPKRILHTAKVELTYQQKINPYVGFLFHVDSLKAVNDLDEWLIDSDLRFQIKLYKFLNLLLGYSMRYDNVPTTGFRKLDTISSVSLGVLFQSPERKVQQSSETSP